MFRYLLGLGVCPGGCGWRCRQRVELFVGYYNTEHSHSAIRSLRDPINGTAARTAT